MSPRMTLMNWGSSSTESLRRIAPNRVLRGSSGVVQPGPRASASVRMERNLMVGKGRASNPIRSWM